MKESVAETIPLDKQVDKIYSQLKTSNEDSIDLSNYSSGEDLQEFCHRKTSPSKKILGLPLKVANYIEDHPKSALLLGLPGFAATTAHFASKLDANPDLFPYIFLTAPMSFLASTVVSTLAVGFTAFCLDEVCSKAECKLSKKYDAVSNLIEYKGKDVTFLQNIYGLRDKDSV